MKINACSWRLTKIASSAGEDVGAVADVDYLERAHGIDNGARPDRHARRTQCAGEADDIVGELLGLLRCQVIDGHGSVLSLVIPSRRAE
ncbi:hypothetical protein ACVW0I_005342 [Bradyrhizobium sp. LM6.11]